jgi:hypothetical protein
MRAGFSIGGEIARQRRVRDQQRAVGFADERQTAKAGARIRAARRALREGVVAAGVEQDDLLRRRRGGIEQLLERDGPHRRLVLALDLHVGRRQHVLAVDLHAVAGIIDERHFGAGSLTLELLQSIEQSRAVEIVIFRDLEAVHLELGGDRLGVGHGIDEARQMPIVPDADDERDALCLRSRRHHRREEKGQCYEDAGIDSGLGMASAGGA